MDACITTHAYPCAHTRTQVCKNGLAQDYLKTMSLTTALCGYLFMSACPRTHTVSCIK